MAKTWHNHNPCWSSATASKHYTWHNLCLSSCVAGTFVASYLAKHHPARVHGCVLVDPVCLGMFMPNLIHNFLYNKPKLRSWSVKE